MIPYVFFSFLTSLHISQQKFSFLSDTCQVLPYSPILSVCTFTEHHCLPSTFSRKLLTALPSELTWYLVWQLVSHWLHTTLCHGYPVMPDFSYCSYSLLRFLRGAIIYSPTLCFSVPHKISALLRQGLKPNICFLRLLKVGKLDRIWTHETQADFLSLLLCDPCKVLLVVDLRFLILIHCYYY